ALVRSLADKHTEVRFYAAVALGRYGPAAKDASVDLAAAAKNDPDESVCTQAIGALKDIGLAAKGVVPVLKDILATRHFEDPRITMLLKTTIRELQRE